MSLTLVYSLNPAHISASAPPLFIFYLHSLGLTCFLLGPRLRQPCFLKASWKVAESSCRLRRGTFSKEMGGGGSWETIRSLKKFQFLMTFPFQEACLWFSTLFCDVPVSLQSPFSPLHYCHVHANIFSWWIFTLCVCNFLGLESSFIFLYLMFRTQTHLWKQEDQVLGISIPKIINLSMPSYIPYSACAKLTHSWEERLWVIRWAYNSRAPSLSVQISKYFRSFWTVARS